MKKMYTGIMVLLVALSGLASAQSAGSQSEVQPGHGTMPLVHAQSIIAGVGFAFAEDREFHVLEMKVVKKNVPPGLIIKMLREQRPLDEIISAIREMHSQGRIRGSMNFAGEHYVLNVSKADRDSLTATVLKPPSVESDVPSILGSIELTVEEYEGSKIATGTLEMDGFAYEVLLHVFPGRKIPQRKVVQPGQREKENMPNNTWGKGSPGVRGPPF